MTSVTDVRGKTWTYTYDSGGRLATIVDPLSHTQVSNTYGSDGRVSSQQDALGHTTSFSWNSSTDTETVTDPRSHTWKDVYTAGNVLSQHVDALSNTTSGP
jgi:YD repeat-containing protein